MDFLTAVTEATYLLARFHAPQLVGWLRGRRWERWVARTFGMAAGEIRQGPGGLTLFGCRGASGLSHELDGAGSRRHETIVMEAKAYSSSSPGKADICTFDRKTFDLYVARRRQGVTGPHWRLLASATPLTDALRRYCYLYGIIVVDPALIPLPMLLRVASHPQADEYFAEQLLSELVRLGEVAAVSLEQRYAPDGHDLRFDIRLLCEGDLDDLLWLQRTLSTELLDVVDKELPGHYEDRAADVLVALGLACPEFARC